MPPLLLSRYKLTTFLECRRRFQLRYLEQRPWPAAPLPTTDEERLGLGQQFHQLVQRYYLGLPVSSASIPDRTLRGWWLTFEKHQPRLPDGRILPELTLTIPLDAHLLHGRFDLLVSGEQNGIPFAHVYDWKTGRPSDENSLRHNWQTRLYLAMLAEGGNALGGEGNLPPQPEHISITYWYVTAPETPVTITYSQSWHEANWAEIRAIAAEIAAQQAAGGVWSLTEDRGQCRVCAYQALCGRQEAGTAVSIPDDEIEPEPDWLLTPELP